MKKINKICRTINLLIAVLFLISCAQPQQSVKSVMDNIVTRFYETMDEAELSSLNNEKILNLVSDKEKEILATKYWMFDFTVPLIVSIMRHVGQQAKLFWLP